MNEKTLLNLHLQLRVTSESDSNNSEELLLVNGLTCYQNKDYVKAISFFSKAYELNPKNKDYLYWKKICLYDSELSSSGQDDPDLQNLKGSLLLKLESYEDAIECFLRAISLDPNISLYYFNNANALNHLEKFNQANLFFDRAIQLDPFNSLYLYSKEINLIENQLKVKPDDHELINSKGCFFLKLKEFAEAEIEFEKAINLDSDKADYHYHRGIALSELGQVEKAHRCFETAKALNSNKNDFCIYQQINMINWHMKSNPGDAELFNRKGKLLFKLTDYATAVRCFSKAIKLDPSKHEYYFQKGNTLEIMDRKEESLKYFTKAKELYSRR